MEWYLLLMLWAAFVGPPLLTLLVSLYNDHNKD